MLTLELLRLRVAGNAVTPIYLTASGGRKYLDIAASIIAVYHAHVGSSLGELAQALDDLAGSSADTQSVSRAGQDPARLAHHRPARRSQCGRAAPHRLHAGRARGHRSCVLPICSSRTTVAEKVEEIAATLQMDAQTLRASLYADLKDRQRIHAVDLALTPEALIQRYNTALAQAMVYRATRMVLDVYDNYRLLFKYMKLTGLMHGITPLPAGYRIDIDGPVSLFTHSERYGCAMANLIPAMLKCRQWRLAAKVHVGNEEKIFRLSPRDGLTSHYRDEPQFNSRYEEALFARFSKSARHKWVIEREGAILALGDTVMIPDFKFTHPDGRVAHLEIVGFWTPQYLTRKLEKCRNSPYNNLIIAIPAALNCAREAFSGEVIHFKGSLLLKDLLPSLERVACVESVGGKYPHSS